MDRRAAKPAYHSENPGESQPDQTKASGGPDEGFRPAQPLDYLGDSCNHEALGEASTDAAHSSSL